MTRPATRCGEPAWKNPPPRVTAPVPMRDWLTRNSRSLAVPQTDAQHSPAVRGAPGHGDGE
jgi:hypothetical protein